MYFQQSKAGASLKLQHLLAYRRRWINLQQAKPPPCKKRGKMQKKSSQSLIILSQGCKDFANVMSVDRGNSFTNTRMLEPIG
jgi:hypothetical protein